MIKIFIPQLRPAMKAVCMMLALFLFNAAAAQEFQVHPSTQDPSILVTLETLSKWEQELSNWGRWGPDDQRGTLNLITPEKPRQAASLVRVGETVTLQHFVTVEKTLDSQTFGPTQHWMSRLDPVTGEPRFALDEIQFSLHDGMLSHLDALCHYRAEVDGEYVIFNGYPQNLTITGCEDESSPFLVETLHGSRWVTQPSSSVSSTSSPQSSVLA